MDSPNRLVEDNAHDSSDQSLTIEGSDPMMILSEHELQEADVVLSRPIRLTTFFLPCWT
jgi:hypothetical protein